MKSPHPPRRPLTPEQHAAEELRLVNEWKARPKGKRGSLKEMLKTGLNLPDNHWYLQEKAQS